MELAARFTADVAAISNRAHPCRASIYIALSLDCQEPGEEILFRQAQLSVTGSPWITEAMLQNQEDSDLQRSLNNRINFHHMNKRTWDVAHGGQQQQQTEEQHQPRVQGDGEPHGQHDEPILNQMFTKANSHGLNATKILNNNVSQLRKLMSTHTIFTWEAMADEMGTEYIPGIGA